VTSKGIYRILLYSYTYPTSRHRDVLSLHREWCKYISTPEEGVHSPSWPNGLIIIIIIIYSLVSVVVNTPGVSFKQAFAFPPNATLPLDRQSLDKALFALFQLLGRPIALEDLTFGYSSASTVRAPVGGRGQEGPRRGQGGVEKGAGGGPEGGKKGGADPAGAARSDCSALKVYDDDDNSALKKNDDDNSALKVYDDDNSALKVYNDDNSALKVYDDDNSALKV
jgi:hypothetical protein